MGIDERQPAAAAPVEKNVVGQRVEFRLVDNLEIAQGQLLARVEANAGLVRNEELALRQLGDKRRARQCLLVKLAAEIQCVADELRRLSALEQQMVVGLRQQAGGLVDAQG